MHEYNAQYTRDAQDMRARSLLYNKSGLIIVEKSMHSLRLLRFLVPILVGLLMASIAWAERPKPIVSEEHGILLSPGMAELMEEANAGDADAAHIVGVQYENGLSVVENYDEAMKWYRKAAQGGSVAALYHIGSLYEAGLGVTRDLVEARKWYEQAAAKGYTAAEIRIEQIKELAPAVK